MYSAEKSIEAAAFFLRQKKSATMDYYDLIKLIYLADREHVRRKGRTITGDQHWSLPWGPVVGHTLDAVRNDTSPEWTQHIRTNRAEKSCTLVADAPPSALSKAELKSLEKVWGEFGKMDGQDLMHYTHRLPEYTDTDSRVEIRLDELARKLGKSEDEVDQIIAHEREVHDVQRFTDQIKQGGKAVLA